MTLQQTLLAALVCVLASWTNGQDRDRVPAEPAVPAVEPGSHNCPSFEYDAYYDFLANSSVTNLYVEEIEAFTGHCCSRRGVLKLKLASAASDPSKRRVLVDLFLDGNPTYWVFNLGDSSTNNGYAGDGYTQLWDAEVQGLGHTFTGYLSENGGSGQAFNIPNLYTTRLTLIAGDGHVIWLPDNNNLFNYYFNPNLFALNGQPDDLPGPSNYDLYLGINRVVSSGRVGSGVCKVGIKFLPEF